MPPFQNHLDTNLFKKITLDASICHFEHQGLLHKIGGFHIWLTSLSTVSFSLYRYLYIGLTPLLCLYHTAQTHIFQDGIFHKEFLSLL